MSFAILDSTLQRRSKFLKKIIMRIQRHFDCIVNLEFNYNLLYHAKGLFKVI